jgi:hypothetical protein
VSIDAIPPSPPAQPPQMSPDKKWFWDGAQWQPIPHHEAAFPSWKSLGEGFVPPLAAPAPAAPVVAAPTRRAAAPTPLYRLAGPAPDVEVPLWRRGPAPTGVKKYANIAAGAVTVVVLALLVNYFVPPIIAARQATPTPTAAPSPTPGPVTRSESAKATFVLSTLDGPMLDLKDEFTQIHACAAGMTSACQDALNATNITATNVSPAVAKLSVPPCIAAPEAAVRSDLDKITAGAQLGLKGFKDNRKSEFSPGYSQVYYALIAIQTDYARVKTGSAACSTQVTGP